MVWEKLIRELNSGKKYMVDLIEQATLAFDQREEWCSKLEALKKRAQYDFIAHSEVRRKYGISLFKIHNLIYCGLLCNKIIFFRRCVRCSDS